MSQSRNVVDLRGGKRPAPRRGLRFPVQVRMTDASPRNSPLRRKRRRMRFMLVALCSVLITIIAIELSFVSYLPRYTINTASVYGTQSVSSVLVRRYIETQLNSGEHPFLAPNNVLLLDTKALAANIVGYFPRIKSVKISRPSIFSNAITATIEERQEFAYWCGVPGVWSVSAPRNCFSMDDTGFIFGESVRQDATSIQKYVFSGGFSSTEPVSASSTEIEARSAINPIGKSFAAGHLPGILVFFQQLQKAGFTPTGASLDPNGSDFSVPLREGFSIKASFGQDASGLAHNLGLILSADALKGMEADIEYVDLRFGDRAYYKLKGEEPSQQGVPSGT